MLTHIWTVFVRRHSWRTFAFVHGVELVGILVFVIFFYVGTFLFSLLKWP